MPKQQIEIPRDLDRAPSLVSFLNAVGLTMPAGAGEQRGGIVPSLQAYGVSFSVAEVDQKLDAAKISLSDRLVIKSAMANARLLRRL
jgi:hypothetical protein